jgi:uncharacterized membrane protein YgcG
MKKKSPTLSLGLSLSLSLSLLLLFCQNALSQSMPSRECILEFESVIKISPKDGKDELHITENITVVALGIEIKRGIFRDLPSYRATFWGLNLNKEKDLQILEVQKDGRNEPWRALEASKNVRTYIGDPDIFIPSGTYKYTLNYLAKNQLVLGKDRDELYWNVTGNNWIFPIEKVRAEILLPPGASPKDISAYTGKFQEKGKDFRIFTESNRIIVETTRPLQPREGLTVSVTWPKGFITPNPSEAITPKTLFEANYWTFLAVGSLLLVVLYYTLVWALFGRDQTPGVVIPMYGPPEKFTPEAARFVKGMGKFDDRSFASAILQLGASGLLRIEKNRGDDSYTLFKTPKPEKLTQLSPAYQKFYKRLFAKKDIVYLDKDDAPILLHARTTLLKETQKEFETPYFLKNSGWWQFGVALAVVPPALALVQETDPEAAFSMVMTIFFALFVVKTVADIRTSIRSKRYTHVIPILISYAFLPMIIGMLAKPMLEDPRFWLFGIAAMSVLIPLTFRHLMKAPTAEGRQAIDHIDGFQHYLRVAEQESLESRPPELTPELFEKFLPYAVALNAEEQWSAHFTDVLERTHYKPQWCTGSSFSNPSSLGSALGSSFVHSAAASSPISSGSGAGGRGSSGGGRGGGGGGGW